MMQYPTVEGRMATDGESKKTREGQIDFYSKLPLAITNTFPQK
jgi:hypothetical protein